MHLKDEEPGGFAPLSVWAQIPGLQKNRVFGGTQVEADIARHIGAPAFHNGPLGPYSETRGNLQRHKSSVTKFEKYYLSQSTKQSF
jgi:hypothetical protein